MHYGFLLLLCVGCIHGAPKHLYEIWEFVPVVQQQTNFVEYETAPERERRSVEIINELDQDDHDEEQSLNEDMSLDNLNTGSEEDQDYKMGYQEVSRVERSRTRRDADTK